MGSPRGMGSTTCGDTHRGVPVTSCNCSMALAHTTVGRTMLSADSVDGLLFLRRLYRLCVFNCLAAYDVKLMLHAFGIFDC